MTVIGLKKRKRNGVHIIIVVPYPLKLVHEALVVHINLLSLKTYIF